MYYERHGTASARALHGAFGTIESCFAGLLPELACYGRKTLMTMVQSGFPSAGFATSIGPACRTHSRALSG